MASSGRVHGYPNRNASSASARPAAARGRGVLKAPAPRRHPLQRWLPLLLSSARSASKCAGIGWSPCFCASLAGCSASPRSLHLPKVGGRASELSSRSARAPALRFFMVLRFVRLLGVAVLTSGCRSLVLWVSPFGGDET